MFVKAGHINKIIFLCGYFLYFYPKFIDDSYVFSMSCDLLLYEEIFLFIVFIFAVFFLCLAEATKTSGAGEYSYLAR
ncbi:Uncharacterised protein [Weeksella virosa]|uniref:Uncharacterized protein n=1 Tax=Weeksella virosa (strain ATCC 43766 / DSM 16922 / JCM 21250 / CCUG 30538 / CDC 9751 / IAM 14551 / NBRC 16016 / NCTC 11634 / CL345/78) TaxID=865938 RepID=F0NY18_WEEVC|nr:hypothetical protein Weevi_0287 [Weeksella virosa DSM 16922]SUP53275.1 Uncharacterised protein [Weeksella virosa]VEH63261.1 Uncharacterised protein [Weeksella virosa]